MRIVQIEIISIAVAAIIAFSCSSKAADEKKAEAPQKLPTDVVVVSMSSLDQQEELAGSLLPNREVEVMSEVTKKVKQVAFADGQVVTKGQVLYRLGDADVHARIKQVQAEWELAKINERRLWSLLQSETVRHEEYDMALAKKQTLEATLDLLRDELEKTVIRAPFTGRIGISKVQTGSLVSPGIPLVTIQEEGNIKIEFSVSEKYLPLVQKGRTIQFSTELNEPVTATVIATEPGVDLRSRNIKVQAIASSQGGKIKPGMSAKIFFRTSSENSKGMRLPTQAFIPGAGGYNVFVVKKGAAKLTPVKIGERDEEEAVVISGLLNGDTIMISNILRAMDGMPVQIINQTK